MDYIDLMLNISELSELLQETTPIKEYLDRCVVIIAHHFDAEVCSVYLYDPIKKHLKMGSTTIIGINPASVSLELGEGLTGLVLKDLRPIMTSESSRHPNYRYFPNLQEERYEAYLGVPILRGVERTGVLVVQRNGSRPFTEADQKSLRSVANQIAAMIDYARLLIDNARKSEAPLRKRPPIPPFIKGRPAAGGWGYGPVVLHAMTKTIDALPAEALNAGGVGDFDEAIARAIEQLTMYQKRIDDRLTDVASQIFGSHILLLQDQEFVGKARAEMLRGKKPVEAFVAVARQLIDFFEKQENYYFRQKADDIRDITLLVLSNLVPRIRVGHSLEKSIVVASDILPSDVVMFSAAEAAGVILIGGGATSHVAILARSLKLPMVIADFPALLEPPECSLIPRPPYESPSFCKPTAARPAPAATG
jgi:phosphotransferase system enzyme I (PtsP)